MAPLIWYQLVLVVSVGAAELLRLDFRNVPTQLPAAWRSELGLPITNDLMHQRYFVNLTVGTPPQHFSLMVDTGSADILVPQMNSSGCAPSCPPGTFDPSESSTFRATGLTFNASYGLTPDLMVIGPYFNDTVHLGGATIPNMTGLGNIPKPIFDAGDFGIVGIGPRDGESVYRQPSSPGYQNASATFPTLYDHLKLSGYINRRIFSLWLNDEVASTGSILFGGVDTSKYQGDLQSLPVLTFGPSHAFTDWAVNLTSVVYVNGTNSRGQNLTPDASGLTVIVDSGSPNMYLPQELADSVSAQMGASLYQGFPYVPCSLRQSNDEFLEFGFDNGVRGPRIRVPYREIIYTFGAPANLGNVTATDGTRLCYLGLIGTSGPIYLLGATFLRSAYTVFDVDKLEISMAQVEHHSGQPSRFVRL